MTIDAFSLTSVNSLDLLTLALNSVRPENFNLSRSRSLSIYRVKDFVERNLKNPALDTAMIVSGIRLSARYINELFDDEDTSLMRFVWQRRLERCHQELINPTHSGKRVSEIALGWGFNDFSHFSRAFKQKYGTAPRSVRP
jgi:AraC-like DNA-binding protein